MVNTETNKRVEDKILECLLTLQSKFNRTFDIPTLVYKQIGRTAGQAYLKEWKVVLNPDFCKNGHLEDMIHQTLPHEVAHLVAHKLFGSRGHDWRWRLVMNALGVEADRCHDYSLEGVKTRKSKKTQSATCPTCGESLMITPYRVRQIQRGAKVYCIKTRRCRYAKQTLVVG